MKFFFIVLFLYQTQSIKAQITPANSDSLPKPRRINFIPTSFSNKFSLNLTPAVRINSGDTVRTETIDFYGRDRKGVKRRGGSMLLTGPFYIENAKPGDVLQITLTKILFNRSYTYFNDLFALSIVPDSITRKFKNPYVEKWQLDIEKSFAIPDSSLRKYNNLKGFKVPMKQFLRCAGVAPSNKHNEIKSSHQGNFGGNLGLFQISQSAIIYLPVFHEGGYFYIGDGFAYAVQSNGEIVQNNLVVYLTTSLNVEFIIKVIKNNFLQIKYPIVEDTKRVMTMGSANTLYKANRIATSGLLEWLQSNYHLTWQEAIQVVSKGVEYTVSGIGTREIIVIATVKKEILKGIKKNN
jgi:amidase